VRKGDERERKEGEEDGKGREGNERMKSGREGRKRAVPYFRSISDNNVGNPSYCSLCKITICKNA